MYFGDRLLAYMRLKYEVTSLLGQLYKQDYVINTELKLKK